MHRLLAVPVAAALISAASPTASLDVSVHSLRNGRGQVHACVTSNSRFFPDCSKDPQALRQSVRAGTTQLRFSGLAPGQYAVTLIHDENANQRLDTILGIPREGFGFSRNPAVRFGAPSFRQVHIELKAGFTRASVRMQYLL